MSNHNGGSIKCHSTESALLEKRLMLDLGKRVGEQVAWATSYLEACCDRKLPSIGDVVEEPIRINSEAIKIVTKTIKKFRNSSWSQ